jgi:hypothetical protein
MVKGTATTDKRERKIQARLVQEKPTKKEGNAPIIMQIVNVDFIEKNHEKFKNEVKTAAPEFAVDS